VRAEDRGSRLARGLTAAPLVRDELTDEELRDATVARKGHYALGSIAGLLVLAHLLTLERYGVFRDELYYVACGERLAWGYVDHPPFVALLARASRILFGESVGALRIVPIFLAGALVLLTGAIVRRLGGGVFAQVVAALCVAGAPHYLFVSHILSMNSPELLLWTAAAWLVTVAILRPGPAPGPWLAFGAVAGVGLLNKHGMLLMGLGVFVGLVLTPARRHLATPWPWLAGLLAAALFAPHVLWQVQNGWPMREFVANAQEHKIAAYSPVGFLGAQALLVGPLALAVAGAGVFFFAARPEARPFRLFAWCAAVVVGILLVQRAKPYYLTPIYPVLFAGGAVLLERLTANARRLRGAVIALLAALAGLMAPFALPVLSVPDYLAYAAALGVTPAASAQERHRLADLPQHFADMFGWEDMARAVSAVYDTLSPEEKASARVFGQNYGEAGAMEFFRRSMPLPPAVSSHNNYWLWGPGPDGGVLIVIGGDRDDLDRVFASVTEAGRTHCDHCMPYENDLPIYVGRGWKTSLRELWPQLKRFI
jgi:hypothetical protein